jgi:aquaporin Z
MAVLLQLGQAVGNTPFNPARATASALFSNADALSQLWLFWAAPLVGAVLAGLVFRGFAQVRPVPAAEAAVDEDTADEDGADAGHGDGRVEDEVQARPRGTDEAREFFDSSRAR